MDNNIEDNKTNFNDELKTIIQSNPNFIESINSFREDYIEKIKKQLESIKIPNQLIEMRSEFQKMSSEFQKLSSQLAKATSNSLSEPLRKSLADFEANSIILSSSINIQQSEFIKNFEEAKKNFDFRAIGKIVADATKIPNLSISDFSYLKLSLNDELIKNASKIKSLPKQLITFDNQTALRLLNNQDFVYDTKNEVFTNSSISENDKNQVLTGEDLNSASSTVNLLNEIQLETKNYSNITIKELTDFITALRSYGYAVNFVKKETSLKIYEIIKNNKLGFVELKKKENYYHGRIREVNRQPFYGEEMEQCPREKSNCGRYNRPGLSCYYMSDSIDGAEKETLNHLNVNQRNEYIAQIAMVSMDSDVRLLDLSVNKKEYNDFYQYLRSPIENIDDKWPKEYLLSNYVADCCRACSYDGIKYYGEKNYSNFVLWKDGKVKFVKMVKGDEK
jgi:hypothetical protein